MDEVMSFMGVSLWFLSVIAGFYILVELIKRRKKCDD